MSIVPKVLHQLLSTVPKVLHLDIDIIYVLVSCVAISMIFLNLPLFYRYDRSSAGNAFRRCLEIREFHLEKDHIQIADVLFELGMFCETLQFDILLKLWINLLHIMPNSLMVVYVLGLHKKHGNQKETDLSKLWCLMTISHSDAIYRSLAVVEEDDCMSHSNGLKITLNS